MNHGNHGPQGIFVCLLLGITVMLSAQDFGFGFDDTDVEETGSGIPLSIGGEVRAELVGYGEDVFSSDIKDTQLGDIFSGKLNFSAETSHAKGVINLQLSPTVSPVAIDEAYMSAFFGNFDIEGGLRKLIWGKADSFGPLDVINPLDSSNLTNMTSVLERKIARPLVHASYRFGQFSKLEGVFVPTFEGIRFAASGRWVPPQFASIPPGLMINTPDTSTLEYAQAGLRFTTTVGPADIGFQYYYGRLSRPAMTLNFTGQTPSSIDLLYNPYHQIGVDWAQVVGGFNIRAEAAANITGDLAGDDGSVYNPAFAWSLGFDRDLFWTINLNLQVNETIRLLDSKITSPLDIEADTDKTSTRVTARLSKMFLRDELEVSTTVIWGIEDSDCLIMPSLTWTKNDVSVEVSCGIFAGNEEGELGAFHDNSFIRVGMTYTF
jgi:hypothetical protein